MKVCMILEMVDGKVYGYGGEKGWLVELVAQH
jgi:hypothetical protein